MQELSGGPGVLQPTQRPSFNPQRGHRGGGGKLASPAASILVHLELNHSYDSKPAIPRGGSMLNCSISGCQFDWSNEIKLPIKRGGRGK